MHRLSFLHLAVLGLAELFSIPALFAARKPVTLQAVAEAMPPAAGSVLWAPDGSAYATQARGKLTLYRLNPRSETILADLKELEGKAIAVKKGGPFEWENRRLTEQPLQWSADGRTMLVLAGGDLFLIDVAKSRPSSSLPPALPNATPSSHRIQSWSPTGRITICTRSTLLPAKSPGSPQTARPRA